MQADAVGAGKFVDRTLLRAVLAAVFVGRVQQAELDDQPAVVDLVAQPLLGHALARVLAVEEALVITLVLHDGALVALGRVLVTPIETVWRQIAFP